MVNQSLLAKARYEKDTWMGYPSQADSLLCAVVIPGRGKRAVDGA